MKNIAFEYEKTLHDAIEPVVGAWDGCVINSAGPIQSLKPDGFREATRTK